MATTSGSPTWYSMEAADAAAALGVTSDEGLSASEARARLARHGPNSLPQEPPPSLWSVVRGQVADPMNIMLLAVAIASIAIGQGSTGILVGLLVALNVGLGANQERKAQASVEALAQLQVPSARVLRDGRLAEIAALDVVQGDIVTVEAGDLVPADGRLLSSATLEVQESALTGESAPVAKDVEALADDVALGDRTAMVFQNTSVTRGTGTFVVTATGATTEMGKIAGLLRSVSRTRSPLQRELAGLTKWLGAVAWGAVAIIFVIGLVRGLELEDLILLAVATAIAAIPTGMPTFVQAMLSSGARRLADAKAVIKNLSDVETLGATSAINSDKTGTLTLNQMTSRRMLAAGRWYSIEGSGYDKRGAVLPRRRRGRAARPDAARVRAHPLRRRDRLGRRDRGRRPDRGGAHRAGGQDRRRRRDDPPRAPADRRGALRLGVQVHGDLPRRAAPAGHVPRPRQGRAGRRARTVLDARSGTARRSPSRPSATRSWRPTASCPRPGSGCSRSPSGAFPIRPERR